METNAIEKNWNGIKSKIKSKWSKFSDSEIENMKSDFDSLPGKIEKTYGLSTQIAKDQFSDFKKSVQSLIDTKDSSNSSGGVPEKEEKNHSATDKSSE